MNYSKSEAFKLRMRSVTLPVLQVLSLDLETIGQQLEELKIKTPNLFQGTPMIVDIESLDRDFQKEAIDWKALFILLQRYGIFPVGIQGGSSAALKESFGQVGIPVFSADKPSEKELKRPTTTAAKKSFLPEKNTSLVLAKIISKPVRSGQQVYAEGADLIVLSSVSPGAELLADGNIHVYGVLRGRALAGIQGNQEARIFCQQLEADLVAIAGSYMTSDAIDRSRLEGAQQIALEEGRLVISPL